MLKLESARAYFAEHPQALVVACTALVVFDLFNLYDAVRLLVKAQELVGDTQRAADKASRREARWRRRAAWELLHHRRHHQGRSLGGNLLAMFIVASLLSILLAVLSWIVPRLQPMVLALWLAAMGAEIATSIVTNLLHALGAGDPTDAVLGGASVISAVLRSLAFALALWGGLELLRNWRGD